MDLERRQRNDIDDVSGNRLTLDMDALTLVNSPYVVTPERYEANNWVIISDKYTKYSIAEDDMLAFVFNPITDLSQKNITDVTVSFDFIATNILLDNISLSHYDLVEQKICKIPLNGNGHIDVSCNIFGLNNEVLNSIISEQGFNIGLNFKGLKSNSTVRIWNVEVSFKFTNKLYDESDAVVNRLEPYVDFYRDDDELILQIGDGSGKGHKEDQGGDIDAYTKAEVDAKLELKVNTQVGKGLSSNDYTLAEKTKLSTIESNANYYVHPSSHQTGMIVESSALDRLETSANATQHEINLAINSKIGQGGGGSVIGTGSFSINSNGHLIVELPNGVDNPYFINNNGHLVYDTSNTYNGE